MMLEKIIKLLNAHETTVACLQLQEQDIEEIYQVGVAHGLFPEENYGLHDKRNSVYAWMAMLGDLHKSVPMAQ